MKIIDIRIEVRDDLCDEAKNVAYQAAYRIGDDLGAPKSGLGMFRYSVSVGVTDATEEAMP